MHGVRDVNCATTLQALAGTAYACNLHSAFTDYRRNVSNSVLFTAPKLAKSLLQDWDSNHMLLTRMWISWGLSAMAICARIFRDLPKRHS